MTMTLAALQGRVLDVDSHEMVPVARYGDIFGERGRRFAEGARPMMSRRHQSHAADSGPDVREITPQNVWELKGTAAPGSMDFDRRPQVLDVMGIRRQLVFSTFAGIAYGFVNGHRAMIEDSTAAETYRLGLDALDAYHEWAVQWIRKYPDRLRMAAKLPSATEGLTPTQLAKDAQRLIDEGFRAVLMAHGRPPAGLSPANPALDVFYATIAEANVALVFHVGGSAALFRQTDVWEQTPQFPPEPPDWQRDPLIETVGDPIHSVNGHASAENFIAVMVLGGVFERHPTLRVGAVELGSSWIGPLAERMDMLTDEGRHHRSWADNALPLRPSEYLARNVRVAPYVYEPVERYLELYPQIQDVYCYTSDYPHVEGTKWSMQRFYDRLAASGDDILEKFFVTNAELLIPE